MTGTINYTTLNHAMDTWMREKNIHISLSNGTGLTRLFTAVRDIEFYVRMKPKEYAPDLAWTINNNKGGCGTKHQLAWTILRQKGFETTYSYSSFYWHELNVDMPPEIRTLAKGLLPTRHLALYVGYKGETRKVDLTWDSALERAGFPINKAVKGIFTERPAVPTLDDYNYNNEVLFSYKPGIPDLNRRNAFYTAFNGWLESLRAK